jgi:hypothetical protein
MLLPEIFSNNNASANKSKFSGMATAKGDKTRRGRPRLIRYEVRANRVVTFVTDAQLEMLGRLASMKLEGEYSCKTT